MLVKLALVRRRERRGGGAPHPAQRLRALHEVANAAIGDLEPEHDVRVTEHEELGDFSEQQSFVRDTGRVRNIVKDVRGSESNCEQDSRKM